jgi:hypothetical protein
MNAIVCLLFTILHPFGTRESIRRKVDDGGQIVLWYWQNAMVKKEVLQVALAFLLLPQIGSPNTSIL